MKQWLKGLCSGVLLLGVLAGNLAAAIQENRLAAVQTMGESRREEVLLPVLMYHHILKDPARWGDYVISPRMLEEDLKYLKLNGYTSVGTKEILEFRDGKQSLPEKPVLLTFDDGYESTYAYAFPLLQKYRTRAVLSIIGKYADFYSGGEEKNLSYAHADWAQLREMQESGLMEIGNHTYDLHQNKKGGRLGIRKLPGESPEEYRRLLREDVDSLSREMEQELGKRPEVFAYPFGAFSKESDEVLRELGFRVILTCEERVNRLSRGSGMLYLKRYNRPAHLTSEQVFAKFRE